MLHRALAPLLGLKPAAELDPRSVVRVHTPTRRPGIAERVDRLLLRATAENVPESYERGESRDAQCIGPMSCSTGVMGRATTILVRKRAGSTRLEITLERLPRLAHLYPLEVTIAIPTVAGSPRFPVTLRADGPAAQTFSVPVPGSLRPGVAMDVTLQASRAAPLDGLSPRSLVVAAIEQR
jgi:hypothetical protein